MSVVDPPPPLPPAPNVGEPQALPGRRPSPLQGCLIAAAGLILAGSGCFGCLLAIDAKRTSDALMFALAALVGVGALVCLAGCVLALVRIVQRMTRSA